MWLVLCPSTDAAGLWAYQRLSAVATEPVQLVTQEVLGLALRWEHWLGDDGVGVRIALADGRIIDSRSTGGVLNRLVVAQPMHLALANAEDRTYAEQEFGAFFMSWLHALPGPVLNRPTPMGLSGAWRHPSEWAWFASQAGIPVQPYRMSSATPMPPQANWTYPSPQGNKETVFVAGDKTLARGLPDGLAAACVELARMANLDLIGIDMVADDLGRWWFGGASPVPDLRPGGEPLIAALHETFTHGRTRK